MSFASVKSKTVISRSFSATDQSAILAALGIIYTRSTLAQAMIDDWLINPRRFIKIEYAANNAYVKDVNSGRLYIDVSYAPKLFYISPTGKAVQTNLVHMLLHELGHALTTKKDNIGIIDYKGDNVRFTNPMLTQLGIPERLSYNATDYESSLGGVLERNFEYTNGASIDRAQIGDRNLSMTPLTLNSKDLLIGGPSANILQSSFGDDYLWGAGGDDQLYGGGGTDMVGYMGKAIDYDVRLNPDDTWMVRHARGEKNEGTDIVINAEKILFKDGKTFDLKKKGLSYQSDFALVIDTTGSMGDDIDAVKRQGAAIINALFSDDTRDARVGIIGFKDTTIGEPSSVLLPFTDQDQFSDRRAAALNALNSIGVGGGGDLPETAFDGLLKAFSPAMGGWRPGAGLSRIVLFTDAPAKDSTLQSQVNKLASNISATITPGLRGIVGSGMIETMTLSPKISSGSDKSSFFPGSGDEDPDLPPFTFIEESPTPDTSTASLEIYTIYTGNSGSIDPDLKSIALSTGGDSFNAPNPDDLVETLLSIIDLPADLPKFLLTGSATELWEGDRLAVSLTSSKVPSGTPLYWSLTGSGITASDFPDGITTGVGVVGADGRYSFSRVLALDSLSDPNESLDVKFFSDASRKTQIGSTLSVLIKERLAGLPTDQSDTITGTANPLSSREIIRGVPVGSSQRGKQSIDILTGLAGPDTFVLGDSSGTFYDDGIASQRGSLDLGVILDFNAGDLIQLHGQPTNYKLSRGAYTAAGLTNMQGVIINRVSAGAIDETIGFVRGASLATLSLADSSQFIYAGLIR